MAELTRVTALWVRHRFNFFFFLFTRSSQLAGNQFGAIPAGAFAMTQLTSITVSRRRRQSLADAFVQLADNRLSVLPREIGLLTALKELWVSRCRRLPRPD